MHPLPTLLPDLSKVYLGESLEISRILLSSCVSSNIYAGSLSNAMLMISAVLACRILWKGYASIAQNNRDEYISAYMHD